MKTIAEIIMNVRECADAAITFRFRGCRFLRPHAIVALSAAQRLLEERHVKVIHDYSECGTAVIRHLEHCGFKSSLYDSNIKSTLPILQVDRDDPVKVAEYLQNEWLGRSSIDPNSDYAKRILSAVGEITDNVFQHSKSVTGMTIGGQLYPNARYLQLVVVDLGIGIRDSVCERFPPLGWMKASDALAWAFKPGFSRADSPRGLGLSRLREFVIQYKGQVKVFSDAAYATISRKDSFGPFTTFPGTLVEIGVTTVPPSLPATNLEIRL